MSWFMRQRQDFIRAQLETFGMIRRKQIVDRFEVTIAVASADIQSFIAAHPDAIDYDRSVKCYTLDKGAVASPAPKNKALSKLATDFRSRAHLCRTNLDAYDAKAAGIWDLAAEAVDAA